MGGIVAGEQFCRLWFDTQTHAHGRIGRFDFGNIIAVAFALAYLAWCAWQDTLIFSQLTTLQTSVLLGAGVATTLPLLCFAASAKRISMSLLGMLQYISPTLQFTCGLLLFNELFDVQRLVGFGLVWAGVLLFYRACFGIKIRQPENITKSCLKNLTLSHNKRIIAPFATLLPFA